MLKTARSPFKRLVLPAFAAFAGLAAAGCANSHTAAHAQPRDTAGAAQDVPAPAPAAPLAGEDFTHQARLLFRVVACGGSEPVPAEIQAVVDAHCRALRPLMDLYRRRYVHGAQSFLTSLQPAELPQTVVYPFGGGDLLSALTTYPRLSEVTTLSLEHAGDPRRIDGVDPKALEDNLLRLRKGISGLLALSDSTSESLMQLQRGEIPGQLAFFLVGLAIHGQEPVSLRYFTLEPDGSLHYLSAKEIETTSAHMARNLNHAWKSPDFSVAFSNSEIRFRAAGSPAADVRVHRHIAANLMDGPVGKDPRVIRHLEAKGRVTAMTKAASYILWNAGFARIRNYLLGHMEFMISDSTGIPPRHARAAGFVQETYGSFSGPFLQANVRDSEDFCDLWNAEPRRSLPFRYGYVDVALQNHLLVTKRVASSPTS